LSVHLFWEGGIDGKDIFSNPITEYRFEKKVSGMVIEKIFFNENRFSPPFSYQSQKRA